MTLNDIVENSPFKKKILLPAAFLVSLFAAQNAQAQEFDSPAKRKPVVEEVKKGEKPSISDPVDGYLRIGGRASPLETALFADANLTLKPARDFYVTLDIFGQHAEYDNGDSEDLVVNSERFMFGIGGSPIHGNKLELYLQAQIGGAFNQFSEAVDLDANQFRYGGKIGIASRNSGTRFLFSGNGGSGEAEYELLSGLKGSGRFDSYFFGAEFRQRLFGKKIDDGSENESSFDPTETDDLIKGFDDALYVSVMASLSRDILAEPQIIDRKTLRVFVPYEMKFGARKGEKGLQIRVGPYLDANWYDTKSDLSLRTTENVQLGGGLKADLQYKNFIFGGEIGGINSTLETDDPGAGIRDKERERGLRGMLYVGFKF